MPTQATDFYNVKILRVYIAYLREQLNWSDNEVNGFLAAAEIEHSFFAFDDNWFGQSLADRFHSLCVHRTGDQDIAYKVGQYAVHRTAKGAVGRIVSGLLTPSRAYKTIGKIASQYSTGATLVPIEVTRNSALVRAKKVDLCDEQPYQCRNRLGMLQAIPVFTGRASAAIEHPRCMHRGDDTCDYAIRWQEQGRFSYAFVPLGGGLTVSCALLPYFSPWISALTGASIAGIIYTVTHRAADQRLRSTLNEQVEALGISLETTQRRHQELVLINEISLITNRLVSTQGLFEIAADAIYDKMQYDRVTIFHLDKTKEILKVAAFRGFPKTSYAELKKVEFSIKDVSEPGLLGTVVNDNSPVFVPEVAKLRNVASDRSWEFLQRFDIKAFIAVPISFEDKPYGVIAVDRVNAGNAFTRNDMDLLTHVGRQIAVAFTNVLVHTELQTANELLEQRVEERTAALVAARDEAVRAYKAKSMFLAKMSHELRTPLNSIIGYSELLCESAMDDGLDEYVTSLTRIGNAGTHLLDMINEILDYSRIETGTINLALAPFSFSAVLEEVASMAAPLILKNDNRLVITNDVGCDELFGDGQKFKQILINILGNACKFTKNGCVQIHAYETQDGDIGQVTIDIADTGIGIDPAHMQHLFTAFYQGEGPLTKSHGGTGLGLAISHSLCSMMGGHIGVKSQVGQGSTFTISIPRQLDQSLPKVQRAPSVSQTMS